MKVKSISDLAFQTLDQVTDNEDQLWISHAIFNREATRTGEIQKIMSDDCGLPSYAVPKILKTLVMKGLIIRVGRGKFSPNLKLLLPMMIEMLEAEGGKVKW